MSNKKFTKNSTALDVIKGHNLNNYEVIVTGASSGIGVETARAFAKAGARVILTGRDMTKLKLVADDLIKTTGNDKIEIEKLELNSLKSVNEFVEKFMQKNRPLNILINNAASMGTSHEYTEDGFEFQFGTNYIGHFALTYGLIPALKKAAEITGKKSRVISVSSLGHVFSNIHFDDINFKKRAYDKWLAYAQSKTANSLFSVALTKLYSDQGIVSNAVMPGAIFTPGTLALYKDMTEEEKVKLKIIDEQGNANTEFKTVEQGASTTVWAAVADELEGKGGFYLEDCDYSEQKQSFEEAYKSFHGYLQHAINENDALKLWNLTMNWIKKS